MAKNTLKLITIIAQFSLFFALSNAKGEQQTKEIAPTYTFSNISEEHNYTCDFLNPRRFCVWSLDSIVIDPTSFNYSFVNKDTNCTIRSNDSDIGHSGNLTCTGHLIYNNTSIITVFSGSVELSCLSNRVMDECVWKRDGTRVKIGGSYSFVGNGNKTKDCSIRIKWVTRDELGEWTCHYYSTEYREETEVVAAFTISLGEGWSMGSVVAFTASVSVLFGFMVGLSWKRKCCKTNSLWKKSQALRSNNGPSANHSVTIH